MNAFNGPAHKRTDDKLFGPTTSPGLRRLNKAGRTGLRQKAREAYWAKIQADQQPQQPQQPNG